MKISVIIACKNEKDTVEKTIESVLSQSYKNFEIIVLDGNSTDGTLEILQNYQDKIRLVKGQAEGIYSAMNEGINLSTGDLLYFLNANDSLFSNDVFEEIIQNFKEENCDIIFGDTNFQTTDKNGKVANTIVSHSDFYSKFVWAYRNLNHQSTFYKKWLFVKYGNYKKEEFEILADVEFTTHVITQSDVSWLYIPLVIANYNAEGFSSYNNPQNVLAARREKEIIAKKYLNFEYNMFLIYNFFFAGPSIYKLNGFLKKKWGVEILYKIRDFKRILGRTFIWWIRKI